MIIRSDVPAGIQAAMMVHAAGHSAQLPGAAAASPPTTAVVLAVSSVDELLAIHRVLVEADLPHVLVREPDEPWRDAPMAIGVVPMPRARVRPLLAQLALAAKGDVWT